MSHIPIRPVASRLIAVAGAVVVACSISSVASAATVSPAAPSRAAAAPCAGATDLSLKVVTGPRSGTAGVTDYTMVFTNTSMSTCSLSGFPFVSMVNKKGGQLGSAAGHPTMLVIPLITLAPGASAHTTLAYHSGKVRAGSGCGTVTTAYQLRAFVANQKRALFAKTGLHACSRTGHVFLNVLESYRAGKG